MLVNNVTPRTVLPSFAGFFSQQPNKTNVAETIEFPLRDRGTSFRVTSFRRQVGSN